VDLAEDMLYRLARCCHPVHGETIVGLVTKQRGISIHRDDCVNIRNFRGDRARLLPLQWEGLRDGSKEAVVQLALEAIDRKQLLADVTNVIASAGIDIRKSQSGNVGKGRANLLFEISVRDIKELRRLASNLIEVKGVLNVSEKRGSRKHPLA
jgi:GTP pyrophosphokinase